MRARSSVERIRMAFTAKSVRFGGIFGGFYLERMRGRKLISLIDRTRKEISLFLIVTFVCLVNLVRLIQGYQ